RHVRPLIGIDQQGIALGPDVLLPAERALNGLRSVGRKIEAVGIGLDAGGNAAPRSRTLDEKQGHPGLLRCVRSPAPKYSPSCGFSQPARSGPDLRIEAVRRIPNDRPETFRFCGRVSGSRCARRAAANLAFCMVLPHKAPELRGPPMGTSS